MTYYKKINGNKFRLMDVLPEEGQGWVDFYDVKLKDYSSELKGEEWLKLILRRRKKMIEAINNRIDYPLQMHNLIKTHPYLKLVEGGLTGFPVWSSDFDAEEKREFEEDREIARNFPKQFTKI